jgi:hypothetical protein
MVCEGGAYGEASRVLRADARVPTLLSDSRTLGSRRE